MLVEQSTINVDTVDTSKYLAEEILQAIGISVEFDLEKEDGELENEDSINQSYFMGPIPQFEEKVPYDNKDNSLSQTEAVQDFIQKQGITKEMYSNYGLSIEEAIYMQMNVKPMISNNNSWVGAKQTEVMNYLVPTKYNVETYKYQFLDLSASANIDNEILAEYLKSKGVLDGMESVFIEAGQKYNVNEIYLVAHALLETGNGDSELANGVHHNGVKVYNMFGIGAIDSSPIGGGASYAYKMGWTTPEKAIEGGAKYISDNYVNHEVYAQDTLYEMRWNPARPCTHQYATDVAWAVKQSERIKEIYKEFETANKTFDIPIYR